MRLRRIAHELHGGHCFVCTFGALHEVCRCGATRRRPSADVEQELAWVA